MKQTIIYSALSLATLGSALAGSFTEIDFTKNHDWNGIFINGNTFPTGPQVLGGVPFDIPSSGNVIWHSYAEVGPNPRVLSVPVSLFGVTQVHTLINSFWGETDPANTFAQVEFFGSDGAYEIFHLDGNDDIRDYNQNLNFSTSINGTTTIEVFNNGSGQRLDKQLFDLSPNFADETLTEIRFSDSGADDFQRIFVAGITAEVITTPELSSTLALFGIGIAGLTFARRRLS